MTEDQEKLLTEALNVVKKSSFDMKTCLVGGNTYVCTCNAVISCSLSSNTLHNKVKSCIV